MDDRQERVMVFIDGSNMYHSLKSFFSRTDVDLGKFCNKLLGLRHLVRIYYYNARVSRKEEPERYVSQYQFFDSVAEIPYTELRLGRLVYNNWPNTPPYEKGVDVQLATDMLNHSFKNNYDTAILVAGDNDFVSALQTVKDNGKHIEVALFGKEESSQELRRVADKILPIDAKLLIDCWKQPKPARQPKQTRSPKPKQPAQQQPQAQNQPLQPQNQPSQQQNQQQQQQQNQQQQPHKPRPRRRRPYQPRPAPQPNQVAPNQEVSNNTTGAPIELPPPAAAQTPNLFSDLNRAE